MTNTALPQHRRVTVNDITVHIAEQGEGPLVLLLHGFPESWYSWRHQFEPLARAGYRVVAPDQRGYGETDSPGDVGQYTIMHLVGDVVGLIHALGEEKAVVVGHDWGAPVAWHTALLRPDVVRGVVGLSLPPLPRGPVPPLAVARENFGEDFYMIQFQPEGVADAAMAEDVPATLHYTMAVGGDAGSARRAATSPSPLPEWLSEEDMATFVEQYSATGFTGGLNWYRNIDRTWELLAPWQDAVITPPALFMVGDRDMVVDFCPPPTEGELRRTAPALHEVIQVPDCGHWIQQERPAAVNQALLLFLGRL